ncbi:5'-nucleotidase C-terminal domain-containing protein [Sulfurimonas sp. MAG313]|nr:5'-nucleotidase C-terminal domain-containing protein [Sulfurimonas sp. MAG313]MDF1880775.1 5'-nucleotidase C-terminal domain-containing protein [Sulfurimonas sp. MAG313]
MKLLQSKSIALALGALLLAACGDEESSQAPSVQTTGGNGTVILIELNDLHAHIIPHTEQVRTADNKILLSTRGGLARIKTKLNELKGDSGIVMNIGDTFHGGAEALFSNGNDIVTLVNELPIDIAVMGNWDFAYGAPATTARFGNSIDPKVLRPNFEYIASNVKYILPLGIQYSPVLSEPQKNLAQSMLQKVYKYNVGDDFLSPTKIIERNGVKVGLIGITSDIINRMSPLLAPILSFTKGEQAYINLIEKYSDELKANGAHIVIVMSELGIHKDVQLANKVKADSVNVFFSAHTHEATFSMIESTSGAKVVESGDDTYLGEMKITVVDGKASDYVWKLHEVTQDITPDADLLIKINAARAKYISTDVSITSNNIPPNMAAANLTDNERLIARKIFRFRPTPITLNAPLTKSIGTTTLALTRKDVLENGFNSVFAKLLQNSLSTDMALVPGFRYDDAIIPAQSDFTGVNTYNWQNESNVVLNGDITIENVYRYLPSTNYIATATISGANLKTFIEKELTSAFSPDAFKQAGGWVPGFSGLKIQIDMKQTDGFKLLSVTDLNGNVIEDNASLTVASACARPFEPTPQLTTTTLCGQALFAGVTQDKTISTANFLIDAFSNNLDQNLSDAKNISDISDQELWPLVEFVQPIIQ